MIWVKKTIIKLATWLEKTTKRVFIIHPGLSSLSLYIIILFVFAFIYWQMPGSFYHSTIRNEPSIKDFEYALLDKLSDNIKDTILRQTNSNSPMIGKWKIPTVMVSNISLDDKYLVVRVYLYCIRFDNEQQARIEIMYDLHIDKRPGINSPLFVKIQNEDGSVGVKESTQIYYIRKAEVTDIDYNVDGISSLPFSLKAVHPCLSFEGTNEYCFESPESLENDLINVVQSFSGIPKNDPDRFWRMLYLSAITLTTLGYGDIVPLTNPARLLVGFETFLGPILLGVFLTALSAKLKGNQVKSQIAETAKQKNRSNKANSADAKKQRG